MNPRIENPIPAHYRRELEEQLSVWQAQSRLLLVKAERKKTPANRQRLERLSADLRRRLDELAGACRALLSASRRQIDYAVADVEAGWRDLRGAIRALSRELNQTAASQEPAGASGGD